jgi:hypothetical protein
MVAINNGRWTFECPTVLLILRSKAFIPAGSPFGGNYFQDRKMDVPHLGVVYSYYWDGFGPVLHQRPEQRTLLTVSSLNTRCRITPCLFLPVEELVHILALLYLERED